MTGLRLLAVLLVSAAVGRTEKLPLRKYTAAEGLAHNSVNRIVRDSRGFLWFCTSEGLSRFDGYEFHNYGPRDGLPNRLVNDVLETRSGELWIGTGGGLCRLATKGRREKKFQIYRVKDDAGASYVNALLEDRFGHIWCGTEEGLFRLERGQRQAEDVLQRVDLGMPHEAFRDRSVSALLEDWRGDLWVGAGSGLYRRRSDGRIERFSRENGLPQNFVTALLQDQQRRLWVGTNEGLCRLVADPAPGRNVVEAIFREKDGLGADSIKELLQLADGTLCVGTKIGLSVTGAGRPAGFPLFSTYTVSQGLPASGVEALAEDTAGNLWIGTDESGVAKLAWKSFLTYTADDGLARGQIDSIFENASGRLCVLSRRGITDLYLSEFDGVAFRATRVNLPPGTRLLNWGARTQSVAQDKQGDWWIGTSDGLFRYRVSRIADLARALPLARYTERDGLPWGPVVSVFSDSAGVLWVSTTGWVSATGKPNGLSQWDPRNQTFHRYAQPPWLLSSGVSLFAEDGLGSVWVALLPEARSHGEMARLRGTAIERFGASSDVAAGGSRALYLDRQRRLWVGTNQGGIIRVDHPGDNQPAFTRYTSANGLSSDLILSITEDLSGRIYASNGSGVDRLDVATGQIKRYTSADGLATGEVHASFCDRSGSLWFGTAAGLSRFVPQPVKPEPPPPVMITSLRVGGIQQATSELGETEISGLQYQADQNDVEVRFVGLGFAPGETLRYQYKLEGADPEWNPPSLQRSVNYANLSPDSYRFLVRAVNSEGVASPQPASITFRILPPLWRRWWFQLLLAGLTCTAIYWLHHARVTRLLELERVRTRIATDLHDDIGSSLSQIAILSEVAKRQVDAAHPKLAEPLTDIAGISRELVDSMSDIVWAIDPEQDHLGDLVHRMRRFASDVCSPRDIRLRFISPVQDHDLQMGADLRRQIFLIFKEAIHNLLRHSAATAVSVDFHIEHGWLHLSVADNGHGFDNALQCDGHGLRSMRERAQHVGGAIDIHSSQIGTTVALRAPLGWRMAQREPAPHK